MVTEDDARVWTDGRYYLQAAEELGQGFELMKVPAPSAPSLCPHASLPLATALTPALCARQAESAPGIGKWLGQTQAAGAAVGVDPRFVSATQARTWQRELEGCGLTLVPMDVAAGNLVDLVWEEEGMLVQVSRRAQ